MLTGKTVLLGITGGIACYKAAELTSLLIKQNCDVHVIMTKGALEFMTPLTFEALTGNKVHTDIFDKDSGTEIPHISLSGKADCLIIAPATANVIAKLAHGIADDMLTSTALACNCKKIIAPAMNTRMYENPVTQDNIAALGKYGWEIITPDSGRLACGDTGKGKLPSPATLLESVIHGISKEKDMKGLRVLVTAGATKEDIDPVRYITNHSTGKMGYALAKCAAMRGAEVTLVTGSDTLSDPLFVNTVHIGSAKDMFEKVKEYSDADIIVKAAAVADYRPKTVAADKIKKTDADAVIELDRTDDILKYLGENKKEGQTLCGFSMETKDLIANSRKKLEKKNLDMICANNLKVEGAGFGTSTNVITMITKEDETQLPLMSKEQAADEIFTKLLKLRLK
ncbi:MAG: bifunctional phosphopantothenoylcysteine decarboxylase/phosphopantothenate--cysteine ligase CoaBC [Ruminococcaceae bacterium]|nr:bifunctional phosphopantothenoylcysteine decarboxylase/phosphopantothenate--cysteine ligase CoaBC [Oscillospiraceae bacterium]